MAEIRQELTLVDKFSDTFGKFEEALSKLTGMTDKMERSGKDNNKQWKDMNDWFGKTNDSAQRLADRGLNSLTKRLVLMAGAYVGINKLKQAILEAGQVSENIGKLGARTGDTDTVALTGRMKNLANSYGVDINTMTMMSASMEKIAGSNSVQNKMLSLAARLSAITPGQDQAQVLNALTSSIYSRNISGFIQQYGLSSSQGYDPRANNKANLELSLGGPGASNYALKYLDELVTQAGGTQEALERMWDNPSLKARRMANIWKNELTASATTFFTALKPAIDNLERFFASEEFAKFMQTVSVGFGMIGKIFELMINKIIQNAPLITDVLTKAFIMLYNVLDWVIENFDTIAKVVAIVLGMFLATKIAVTGLNTAMTALSGIKLVFSNPFTGAIAGAIAFMTIIAKICNPDWSVLKSMLVGVGVLIDAILFPFKACYEIIKNLTTKFQNFIGDIFAVAEAFNPLKTMLMAFGDGEKFTELGKKYNTDRVEENDDWFNNTHTFEEKAKEIYNKYFGGDKGESDGAKAYASAMEDVKRALDEARKATIENTSAMEIMNANMDPDKWMEAFTEIDQGELTRNTVFKANNEVNVPAVNINVRGEGMNGKLDARQIMRLIEEGLLQGMNAGSHIASHI